MRRLIAFILLFFCICISGFSQSTFYQSYNYISSNYIPDLKDILRSNDDGFTGVTWNGIIKFDSTLQVKYYKELLNDSNITFSKIIQTSDSGFVIETANDPFDNNGLGCVVKFDNNGNYSWTKRYYYPSVSSNTLKDIISADSNRFYLLASGCAGGPMLIKCNPYGDIVWQKRTDFGKDMVKIIRYSADKFIVFGVHQVSAAEKNIVVTLVDTTGNFIWQKEYSNNGYNWVFDAVKTAHSEFSILTSLQDSALYQDVILHIDFFGQQAMVENNVYHQPHSM